MISMDAILLLYSFSTAAPEHLAARLFIESVSAREDVALVSGRNKTQLDFPPKRGSRLANAGDSEGRV